MSATARKGTKRRRSVGQGSKGKKAGEVVQVTFINKSKPRNNKGVSAEASLSVFCLLANNKPASPVDIFTSPPDLTDGMYMTAKAGVHLASLFVQDKVSEHALTQTQRNYRAQCGLPKPLSVRELQCSQKELRTQLSIPRKANRVLLHPVSNIKYYIRNKLQTLDNIAVSKEEASGAIKKSLLGDSKLPEAPASPFHGTKGGEVLVPRQLLVEVLCELDSHRARFGANASDELAGKIRPLVYRASAEGPRAANRKSDVSATSSRFLGPNANISSKVHTLVPRRKHQP